MSNYDRSIALFGIDSSSESEDEINVIEKFKKNFITRYNSSSIPEFNTSLGDSDEEEDANSVVPMDTLEEKIKEATEVIDKCKNIQQKRQKLLSVKKQIFKKSQMIAKINVEIKLLEKQLKEEGDIESLYNEVINTSIKSPRRKSMELSAAVPQASTSRRSNNRRQKKSHAKTTTSCTQTTSTCTQSTSTDKSLVTQSTSTDVSCVSTGTQSTSTDTQSTGTQSTSTGPLSISSQSPATQSVGTFTYTHTASRGTSTDPIEPEVREVIREVEVIRQVFVSDERPPLQILYESQLDCPVCLESYPGADMMFSPNCPHHVCKTCTNMLVNDLCPLCRVGRRQLYSVILRLNHYVLGLYERTLDEDIELNEDIMAAIAEEIRAGGGGVHHPEYDVETVVNDDDDDYNNYDDDDDINDEDFIPGSDVSEEE